jgi:hypothetical protein
MLVFHKSQTHKNKGRGKFFYFFRLMRTLLRLITLSACIWSTFACLLLVKAAGTHWLEKVENATTHLLNIDQSYDISYQGSKYTVYRIEFQFFT